MSTLLVALSAGSRPGSSAARLARQLARSVTDHIDADRPSRVITLELHPLAEELARSLVQGQPTLRVREALSLVARADGLVAVTPVYQASYSALFKLYVDLLGVESLTGLPTIAGAVAGTTRHQLVLDYAIRPLLQYLHADLVPTSVFATPACLLTTDRSSSPLSHRINRAGAEVARAISDSNPESFRWARAESPSSTDIIRLARP